ncbi:MAG: RluA family pseudouridine synthase [Negativicutes bacterium]|nr:RluA family pseudouridine synthase [Negativicutes bacterium]
MNHFTLPLSDGPLLLKDLLRRLNVSLTLRRKLKKVDGAIRLNGQAVPWQTLVNPGDTVTITWPTACRIEPLAMPLTIVFEDEGLLVVDKPAGLLVHPTTDPTRPSLANAVMHHLCSQNPAASFHPVHRLDRNTSGLILIAKNPHLQHLLTRGGDLGIARTYQAVIGGVIEPPAGTIDAPIGRHPDSIIERMVRPDGQAAVTCYETVQIIGPCSVVKLRLHTGRTHQIRVHLSHIGHPILGDDLYGGSTAAIGRQALHAAALSFTHPLSGEALSFSSPFPADIASLLTKPHAGIITEF